MSFLIVSVAGIFIAFGAKTRFKSFINPVSFFSLGISVPLLFAYVIELFFNYATELNIPVLPMSQGQVFNLSLAYFSAILVFLIPWLLPAKRSPTHGFWPNDSKSYGISLVLVITILVVSILLAAFFTGGIPLISMLSGELDVREYNQALKSVPFGLISLITLLSQVVILFGTFVLLPAKITERRGNQLRFLLVLGILFLCMWQGKRQLLLFFTFVLVCRYCLLWQWGVGFRSGKMGPITITAVMFVIFVSLFVIGDIVRYQGSGANIFSFVGYIVWPIHNMLFILEAHESGFAISNWAVFTELIPARFGGKALLAEFSFLQQIPSSPSGYLSYWWIDGGFLFSMFGVFLLSVVSRVSYDYCLRGYSEKNFAIYLLVLWVCATSGIYTHFISLNFFWLPLLGIIFLPKLKRIILIISSTS